MLCTATAVTWSVSPVRGVCSCLGIGQQAGRGGERVRRLTAASQGAAGTAAASSTTLCEPKRIPPPKRAIAARTPFDVAVEQSNKGGKRWGGGTGEKTGPKPQVRCCWYAGGKRGQRSSVLCTWTAPHGCTRAAVPRRCGECGHPSRFYVLKVGRAGKWTWHKEGDTAAPPKRCPGLRRSDCC